MFRLKTATRRSTAGISTVAKQFCLFIVLLALSTMAHSQVRPEYSGSWYNAKQSGHGFSIEVITADSSIVYWYTYDPFGYPIFLVGDGKNVGNRIEAEVYGYYGMVFGEFDPRTREQVYWGTLTITFHHCSRATLRYDSALRYQTGESFGSGEISLVRLSSMEDFRCRDYALAGVYEGSLWANGAILQGIGFVNESGKLFFGSWNGAVLFIDLQANAESYGNWTGSGKLGFYDQNANIDWESISWSGSFSKDRIWSRGDDRSGGIQIIKRTSDSNRSVSLKDLAGDWQVYSYMHDETYSGTIDANGNFSGRDKYGCLHEGRITIPNPELNVLESSVTTSGCWLAGKASILGAYVPLWPTSAGRMFWLSFNGDDIAGFTLFDRP